MSYHHEMFLKEQAAIEAETAARHERNLKHMEELAKIQPTPSPAELRKAMGVKENVDESTINNDAIDQPEVKSDDKPEEVKADDKVEKASTPEQPAATGGGKYKTRDMTAKK